MGVVSVALRKMRSATTLSVAELCLIAPTFILLGAARVAILTMPFRRYAPMFGAQAGLQAVSQPLSDKDMARVQSIGRIVRRTAQITPWQSLCLCQAMVAALFLRIVGIPFCAIFGLAPGRDDAGSDPMQAHVWVRAGEYNVTGGQNVSQYTIVMGFERPTKAPG